MKKVLIFLTLFVGLGLFISTAFTAPSPPEASMNVDNTQGVAGVLVSETNSTTATSTYIGRYTPISSVTTTNVATDSFHVRLITRNNYSIFPPGNDLNQMFYKNVSSCGKRIGSAINTDTFTVAIKFSPSTGVEQCYFPLTWYYAGRPTTTF